MAVRNQCSDYELGEFLSILARLVLLTLEDNIPYNSDNRTFARNTVLI